MSSPSKMESGMENGGVKEPGAVELENGTVHANGSVHNQYKGHGGAGRSGLLKRAIWHGGSVYDAWLNAVSAQVSSFSSTPSFLPFHPPFTVMMVVGVCPHFGSRFFNIQESP